ncbi:recombinase RecT [Entomobacter blattae]|uniref:RecT family protein n=1 Tax=Entomobacter blattae TaxID=2762277 RepID=A0A7H1NTT6_9PROT|nr:recombinase RecT [Entomobacter blattae]QNT79196.1 RecT family protein [Entomobacter blattae]
MSTQAPVKQNQKQSTPVDLFQSELAGMQKQLVSVLPSHITPQRFMRTVMMAINIDKSLLNLNRESLKNAAIKCAADGLLPDGREAAFVKFGGDAVYMPMFAGIQKRIRNSGEIASIEARVIYENDDFLWEQGTESKLSHKPKFPGDRGNMVGAYAIAHFKDGSSPQFEVMSLDEIEKVKESSAGKDKGPWVQWYEEMARKTVFRRLAKWLPIDAEIDDVVQRDNDLYDLNTVSQPAPAQANTQIEQQAPPSKMDALEAEIIDAESDALVRSKSLIAQAKTLDALNKTFQIIQSENLTPEERAITEEMFQHKERELHQNTNQEGALV